MLCPFCLHTKTSVYNSRRGARLNTTWRRRRCENCKRQFTTVEAIEAVSVLKVKNGKREAPFSRTKLVASLTAACDHRPDKDEYIPYLASVIEQSLFLYGAKAKNQLLEKATITAIASSVLQNADPVAYVKYLSQQHIKLEAKDIRKALRRKR